MITILSMSKAPGRRERLPGHLGELHSASWKRNFELSCERPSHRVCYGRANTRTSGCLGFCPEPVTMPPGGSGVGVGGLGRGKRCAQGAKYKETSPSESRKCRLKGPLSHVAQTLSSLPPSPPGLPLQLWILSKSLHQLGSISSSTGPWTRQVVEGQLPLNDPMVGPPQGGM